MQPPPGGGDLSGVAWTRDSESFIYFQSENPSGASGGPAHIVRQNAATGGVTIIGFSRQSAGALDVLGSGQVLFDGSSGRENLLALSFGDNESKPVTVGNAVDRDPAYSAAGTDVFFSSLQGGKFGLWQISPFTGVISRVLSGAIGDDAEPFPSADGKRLFWSSNRDGHFEIYSATLAEPYPRAVTHDGVGASFASVSQTGTWVVYNSSNPARKGIWKTRTNGVDDTRLVSGDTLWPQVSGDGRYVVYTVDKPPGKRSIEVVSLEQGTSLGPAISVAVPRGAIESPVGRARWMPDAAAIAFIGQDEHGRTGVFTQKFVPGRDTTATRQKLGGFDDLSAVESFTISPDGKRMIVAARERLSELVEIGNLPGISARPRR